NPADAEMLSVLPRARQAGAGIIVRSPLLGGLFSAAADAEQAFTAADPRRDWPEERTRAAQIVVERFCPIMATADCTPAQAARRRDLRRGEADRAEVGFDRPVFAGDTVEGVGHIFGIGAKHGEKLVA